MAASGINLAGQKYFYLSGTDEVSISFVKFGNLLSLAIELCNEDFFIIKSLPSEGKSLPIYKKSTLLLDSPAP